MDRNPSDAPVMAHPRERGSAAGGGPRTRGGSGDMDSDAAGPAPREEEAEGAAAASSTIRAACHHRGGPAANELSRHRPSPNVVAAAAAASAAPSTHPRRRGGPATKCRIRVAGLGLVAGLAMVPLTMIHERLLRMSDGSGGSGGGGGLVRSASEDVSPALLIRSFGRTTVRRQTTFSASHTQIRYEVLLPEQSDERGAEGAVAVQFPAPSSRGPSRRRRSAHRPGSLLVSPSPPSLTWKREISPLDGDRYHDERAKFLKWLDATADPADLSRSDPGKYFPHDDQGYPSPDGCYRPKWSYETHPNCNAFHEISLERGVVHSAADAAALIRRDDDDAATTATIVGLGHYRLPWLVSDAATGPTADMPPPRPVVLKNLRLNRDRNFNHKTYSEIQVEALAFAATSASNRTVDLYGHCGTSVVVERGVAVDEMIRPDKDFHELPPHGPLQPRNSLSSLQKLDLALAMAESVAELHGNALGPIANNDIKLDQWILTPTGFKLNDLNKGRVVKWNPDRRRYCAFFSYYETLYRAPEELDGTYVDESSDVYALGKVLYTLVTGYVPHFELGDFSRAYDAIRSGALPSWGAELDDDDRRIPRNRTFVERRLVETMERCYAHEPRLRPSIFEVVRSLREASEVAHGHLGMTKEWNS